MDARSDWEYVASQEVCCWRYVRYYSDVILSAMVSQIAGVSTVCWTVCSGSSMKTSKLRATGLCEGNPVNDGFPLTKGQWRGKCFHLMTSSCCGLVWLSKYSKTQPCVYQMGYYITLWSRSQPQTGIKSTGFLIPGVSVATKALLVDFSVRDLVKLYVNSSPPIVPHICVGKLGQHWFRWWLGAC